MSEQPPYILLEDVPHLGFLLKGREGEERGRILPHVSGNASGKKGEGFFLV